MSVRLTIEARDTAHARAILEAIERVDASTLGYVSKAALAVAGQWPAETALGSPEATSGPPGDDSGGRFGTAQRARLHALLDEAGRAVDDGDEAGLRRLLGAALDDAASLTLTPAARAR